MSLNKANKAYLLLGSNEGNRKSWFDKALAMLAQTAGTVVQRSSLYETAAWGKEDQPDFLNMAVCLQTALPPYELLEAVLATERQLGRHRAEKWGQRTIDIDILFYNSETVNDPNLTIPHPYIQERRFALEPMNELAPSLMHPVFLQTIAELLESCPDKLPVHKLFIS